MCANCTCGKVAFCQLEGVYWVEILHQSLLSWLLCASCGTEACCNKTIQAALSHTVSAQTESFESLLSVGRWSWIPGFQMVFTFWDISFFAENAFRTRQGCTDEYFYVFKREPTEDYDLILRFLSDLKSSSVFQLIIFGSAVWNFRLEIYLICNYTSQTTTNTHCWLVEDTTGWCTRELSQWL